MNDLNELSLQLTDVMMPWIAILLSIMLAIWFKDFCTKLAKGIAFKLNPQFKEGDKVIPVSYTHLTLPTILLV